MSKLQAITESNSPAFPAVQEQMLARSLTVAIPALNEERNIASTVAAVLACAQKIPDLHVEILVIDDGSKDRTAEIVRSLAQKLDCVRLIQNEINMGLGASIRRAIDAAQGDKFLIVPGDNDIPASTLALLLKNAYAAEVVMCYFNNDESRGRIRFLISTLFMLIYTTCFDLYAQYLNGPAVYPVKRLRGLNLHSTRFSIVSEINVKLLREGVTFAEVPSIRQGGTEGSTSLGFVNLLETFRVFFQVLLDVYIRHPAKYAFRPVRLHYEFSLSPSETEGQVN